MGYLALCRRTSHFELSESAEASLAESWDLRIPTIFVFWQDESLLTGLLAQVERLRWPVRPLPSGFWGQVAERCWSEGGAPTLHVPNGMSWDMRQRTLARGLWAHRRILMPADEGKPRYAVRPMAWQLARGSQGCLVALHVEAPGAQKLFGQYLPLPFSEYRLQLSEPYLAEASLEVTRRTLKESLDGLRRPASLSPPTHDGTLELEPEFPGVNAAELPEPPQTDLAYVHGRQRSSRA